MTSVNGAYLILKSKSSPNLGFESKEMNSKLRQSNKSSLDRRSIDRSNRNLNIKLVRPVKSRRLFNPLYISIVILSYAILNHSMLSIISAGLNVTSFHESVDKFNQEKSLVSLVAANPVPDPAPSSSRSSQRVPPINGSMFGKRSLANKMKSKSSGEEQSRTEASDKYLRELELSQPSTPDKEVSLDKSKFTEATNYHDIVTDIIEEFLAGNTNSDTEEATVAFCRMIVYECHQILSAKGTRKSRRKKPNSP